MNLISKLFGTKSAKSQTTTSSKPFCIENPIIGFLNLRRAHGASLLESHCQVLSPLFRSTQISSDSPPKCQVLFVYCTVGADGKIEGTSTSIRHLIKDAGAYVAVVASENDPDAYIKSMGSRNDWGANIALTIERKGDTFAEFFGKLFKAMFEGNSMLMTWVALAPQISGYDHPDAPGTILAAEAGHLTFKR